LSEQDLESSTTYCDSETSHQFTKPSITYLKQEATWFSSVTFNYKLTFHLHKTDQTLLQGGLALGIIAIFLPPLTVLIRDGCGAYFLIDIILLFLGWIPGVLFAWFVILDSPSMRQRRRMRKEEAQYVREVSRDTEKGSGSRSVNSQRSYHDGPRRRYESRSSMAYDAASPMRDGYGYSGRYQGE
jgi:uncharacterized membrane protein YqaE (UPF0057 family)